MRVISGIYKHRRFEIPHSFKARPTTDFAKENLFNVLASNYFDFEDGIQALDLFAGTGSISLELLSRGCGKVVSIEKDFQHFRFIQQVMKEIKTDKSFLIRGDAFIFIKRCHEQFDFIFADPPYELKGIETIPDLVLSHTMLKENGIFVLEHGKNNDFKSHSNFLDHRSYGSVNFSFFSSKPIKTDDITTEEISNEQ